MAKGGSQGGAGGRDELVRVWAGGCTEKRREKGGVGGRVGKWGNGRERRGEKGKGVIEGRANKSEQERARESDQAREQGERKDNKNWPGKRAGKREKGRKRATCTLSAELISLSVIHLQQ